MKERIEEKQQEAERRQERIEARKKELEEKMRQTADLDSELYQFPNESQGEDTHLMTTLKPNTEPIQS